MRLPFSGIPVGDMSQHKIHEILKELPNVFGIVDDILVVDYDVVSKGHDRMLRWVMQICSKEYLKLN